MFECDAFVGVGEIKEAIWEIIQSKQWLKSQMAKIIQ